MSFLAWQNNNNVMGLKTVMMQQFGRPSGGLGRLVGWVMSKSNKVLGEWTIESLQAKPGDRILEVGYGTGETFQKLATGVDDGFIAGIDHSRLMYGKARIKCYHLLKKGKVELHHGTAWDLNYKPGSFDIIFASNVHFFWQEPELELKKLFSFLKVGGRIVIVYQPRWVKSMVEIDNTATDLKCQMLNAGFNHLEASFKMMKPVWGVCVRGKKY